MRRSPRATWVDTVDAVTSNTSAISWCGHPHPSASHTAVRWARGKLASAAINPGSTSGMVDGSRRNSRGLRRGRLRDCATRYRKPTGLCNVPTSSQCSNPYARAPATASSTRSTPTAPSNARRRRGSASITNPSNPSLLLNAQSSPHRNRPPSHPNALQARRNQHTALSRDPKEENVCSFLDLSLERMYH